MSFKQNRGSLWLELYLWCNSRYIWCLTTQFIRVVRLAKRLEMVTLYHYTNAEGLQAILDSGKIVKQAGAHHHYTTGEAVFLTKVDPVENTMKEILQNNYCGLHENAWLPRRDRASFFIRLVMDPEDRLLDLQASMLASRSVVVYKDEITLDDKVHVMEWTFGYPNVSGFQLDQEL